MNIDAMKRVLEALEWALDFIPPESEIGCGCPLCAAHDAMRLAIEQAERQEPLGYWNAVEGWVELPEESQKPIAWVYPEALEAFQKGQPWTAYGTDGKSSQNSDGVERIPLYTSPPQRQPLTEEEIIEHFKARVDTGSLLSFADGVRFAERKHGIGGGE